MKVPVWVGISLLSINCTIAMAGTHQDPCHAHPTHPGWHVFVDHKDRFCFEYPPKYKPAPTVWAPDVSHGLATEFLGRLTTKPTPMEGASEPDVAAIYIFGFQIPFQPDSLTKFAPTGDEDNPPKHIHAAHKDFYYYGAGGGGVFYPDAFYFGLNSQLFSIDFEGPYTCPQPYCALKSPNATTQKIEPQVLASFRSF